MDQVAYNEIDVGTFLWIRFCVVKTCMCLCFIILSINKNTIRSYTHNYFNIKSKNQFSIIRKMKFWLSSVNKN